MAPTTRSRNIELVDLTNFIDESNSNDQLPREESIITSDVRSIDSFSDVPPVYTIDLSLPPAQRYVQVAKEFRVIIEGLPYLFDDLLEDVGLPKKTAHLLARCVFRKLHNSEQTEELRGIHEFTKVPMYLLVAYNVVLDIFMGCTSGGITVKERGQKEKKMMHFRTLDWGMPALRRALAQFEYKERADGPVIARTINYVGFVGVLTAVKPGLSVSLNFRPYHNNDSSRWANMRYRTHQILVLMGFRASITERLRDLVLPRTKKDGKKRKVLSLPTYKLVDIAKCFPPLPTSSSYLIFCDGRQTLVLEKDLRTAKPLLSSSFITATNHDISYEANQSSHIAHVKQNQFGIGMEELVAESMDRKGCMVAKWEKRCRLLGKRNKGEGGGYVGLEMLKKWLLEYPITNGETHFVTIMDPESGTFSWVRAFEDGYVKGEDSWDEQEVLE
jgi:hypothetical protein